jgi:hypothetical protein
LDLAAAGDVVLLEPTGKILNDFYADCDGVYSGFTDAHLNDPGNFFGFKTNKMFILTQVGNHDALHYGNLVTYLRIYGLEPFGGWF